MPADDDRAVQFWDAVPLYSIAMGPLDGVYNGALDVSLIYTTQYPSYYLLTLTLPGVFGCNGQPPAGIFQAGMICFIRLLGQTVLMSE